MVKRVQKYRGKKSVGVEIKDGKTCFKIVKGKERVKCTGPRSRKGAAKRKRIMNRRNKQPRKKRAVKRITNKKLHWSTRVKNYRKTHNVTIAQAKKALGIGKK